MLSRSGKIDALRKALGTIHQSADRVNVACHCPDPSCPTASQKKKLKLAVRLDDGRYHCWVCGTKGGNVARLVRRFCRDGVDDVLRAFPLTQRKFADDIVEAKRDEVHIPPGFKLMAQHLSTDVPQFRNVIEYVRRRGVTEDDMWRYKLGFSLDEKFVERVIIPSFDANGELNFYMSRAISKRKFPRYVNASTKKHTMVFNELDVDWDSELVLTEGAFDVLNCPVNATCLLGNTMDKGFLVFRRIVENGTPIVLALDAEEKLNTKKIAKLLYSYGISVRIMSMNGYKDLGEMPREEIIVRVADAKPWSPSSSLVDRIAQLSPSSGSIDF